MLGQLRPTGISFLWGPRHPSLFLILLSWKDWLATDFVYLFSATERVFLRVYQGWTTKANLGKTWVQTKETRRLCQHSEGWLTIQQLRKTDPRWDETGAVDQAVCLTCTWRMKRGLTIIISSQKQTVSKLSAEGIRSYVLASVFYSVSWN